MRTTFAVALLLTSVGAFAQGGGPPRWQPFTTEHFSVEMPGRPETKTETLKAKDGLPVKYTTYTVDLGRRAYMTSTSDYNPKTKVSLDGAIEGVLSSWKDPKNLKRRKTTLYGVPAQIVDFTSEDFHVVVRAFAVGKRLYQLGFVEMHDDFLPAHVDRFMKSFRLR